MIGRIAGTGILSILAVLSAIAGLLDAERAQAFASSWLFLALWTLASLASAAYPLLLKRGKPFRPMSNFQNSVSYESCFAVSRGSCEPLRNAHKVKVGFSKCVCILKEPLIPWLSHLAFSVLVFTAMVALSTQASAELALPEGQAISLDASTALLVQTAQRASAELEIEVLVGGQMSRIILDASGAKKVGKHRLSLLGWTGGGDAVVRASVSPHAMPAALSALVFLALMALEGILRLRGRSP